MSICINQIRDLSSLFTRSEIDRWIAHDFTSIDVKLQRYNLLQKNKEKSYLQFLRKTYRAMLEHYPNEYVLKNEFINQKIKELVGTDESVVFNEFRVGKAIADLVLFNGDSKVFEIKTILDKEYRLNSQLNEYKKIFNEVYLIVPFELLEKYLSYDDSVGIITYNRNNNTFTKQRQAQSNLHFDVNVFMNVLYSKEYLKIIETYFGIPETMNSFNQYEISKKLISTLPSDKLNKLFVETMKKRNVNNLFFNKINREFNQICLSMNLKQKERDLMISNLQTLIN